MNSIIIQRKISVLAFLFLISFHLCSFLGSYVSNYYMYFAFFVWIITTIGLCNSSIQKTMILDFVVMGFCGVICFLTGFFINSSTLSYYLQNYIYLFIYSIMVVPSLSAYTQKEKKHITIIMAMLILISSIATIRGLDLYPLASRELATGKYDVFNLSLYESLGIMNYGYIYGITLLPGILIVCRRYKKRRSRFINLAVIVTLFYTIFRANYTLAMIITIICVFSLIMFSEEKEKNQKKIVATFFSLLFIMLLFIFRVQIFRKRAK